MGINHKCTFKSCLKCSFICYKFQTWWPRECFKVIFDKLNTVGISTRGNCTEMGHWIVNYSLHWFKYLKGSRPHNHNHNHKKLKRYHVFCSNHYSLHNMYSGHAESSLLLVFSARNVFLLTHSFFDKLPQSPVCPPFFQCFHQLWHSVE